MKVLIVGGGGYIGSHVVKMLGESTDYELLIVDNFSNSDKENILYGNVIKCDICGYNISEVIYDYKPKIVIHLAAYFSVEESVKDPMKYYENNVYGSINLIQYAKTYGVKHFIFSSSAAVYGSPDVDFVKESYFFHPINPYGRTKLMIEDILKDVALADPEFNYVALRYFNVAGADGKIGQSYKKPSTHIISKALEAAMGKIPELTIYGTDYDTFDGSCVRDYIHVNDIASAHLKSIEYLLRGNPSTVFNCGYSKGYSVFEIVNAVKKITGVDFKVTYSDRRVGDPAVLTANSDKIKITGWEPKYDNLDLIIKSAYDWELEKERRKLNE